MDELKGQGNGADGERGREGVKGGIWASPTAEMYGPSTHRGRGGGGGYRRRKHKERVHHPRLGNTACEEFIRHFHLAGRSDF